VAKPVKEIHELNQLESYLLVDCRTIVLSLIKGTDTEIRAKYGFNLNALINYRKYTYSDYISSIKTGQHRYLSVINIIKILENNGYELKVDIKLKESEI